MNRVDYRRRIRAVLHALGAGRVRFDRHQTRLAQQAQRQARLEEAFTVFCQTGSVSRTAKQLGASIAMIRRRLQTYERQTGKQFLDTRTAPTALNRRVVAAYRQTGTLTATARQLGRSKNTVISSLRRYERLTGEGVLPPSPRREGSHHA